MTRIDFTTFLRKTGNESFVTLLEEIGEIAPIPRAPALLLGRLVRIHMAIGMFEDAVDAWVKTHDFTETDSLLDGYIDQLVTTSASDLDMDIPACRSLWRLLVPQMARENTRFHHSRGKDEANAPGLESLMLHLVDRGIVTRVRRIDRPQQPLETFAYQSQYKYYVTDTGLFRRLARLPAQIVDHEHPSLSRFRGVLSESYALQSLAQVSSTPVGYWKSGHTAEVDFIMEIDDRIYPVEVKTARNVKSHSLALYRRLYGPKRAIRISLLNLKQDDELINIPMYLMDHTSRLIALSLRTGTP